jgi:hypothetical protein
MAAANVAELKKPTSAYWLWLSDNRERIATMLGSGKGSEVAKKAGEMWKAVSDADRKPYETKAKEQKDAYDKFLATEEGKKALGDKKAARVEANAEKAKKEEKRNDRACKAAVKAVEKDDALKKPQTAYWLWLGDNRERIVTMLGSGKGSEVAKKGGEMWKALADADRQPYERRAKEQKDAYDKYLASDEGAAKLKAFKDATKAAKDQFKSKDADKEDDEEEDDDAPSPGKRAKSAGLSAAPPSKRGRGAKSSAQEQPLIPADVLKNAEGLNMVEQLRNLMARADVAASGKSPQEMLVALQASSGLVNKAKAKLCGA